MKPAAFNGRPPAIARDCSNFTVRSQAAACDRYGQVTSFAEAFRVREANGGGGWAEQGCRAHLCRSAARLCHAWLCISGR
jgi:hypothetical protein